MLIDSPRLSEADRTVWRLRSRADAMAGASARITRMTAKARDVIAGFADSGPCHVSCSWGRDSIVVTHLAHGLGIPVVYAVIGPTNEFWGRRRIDNPDTPAVRDAYLARWPIGDYREMRFLPKHERAGTPEIWPHTEEEASTYGQGRPITGIRADESWARKKSRTAHGVATDMKCRPIIDWRSDDVWAYLAVHDLPVHPAYAMSLSGVLPRDRLRVHSLGGDRGTDHGRAEWEAHYYPEVLSVRPPGRRYQA